MKENRDDWLEKEKKREDSISAWDLDEGKKVKLEHQENCEKREISLAHHKEHLNANKNFNYNNRIIILFFRLFLFLAPTVFLTIIGIMTNSIFNFSFIFLLFIVSILVSYLLLKGGR